MKKRVTHDMRGYSFAHPFEYEAYLQVMESGEPNEKQNGEWHVRASWELIAASREGRAPHPKAVEILAEVLAAVQFEGKEWDEAFKWPYRPTLEQPAFLDNAKHKRKFQIAEEVEMLLASGECTNKPDAFFQVGQKIGLSEGRVSQIYYEIHEAKNY